MPLAAARRRASSLLRVASADAATNLPPGPRSPGLIQNLNWFFRPIPFIERCRERYGRVFTIGLGPERNVVVVADPELAHQLITGPPDVFRAGDANGILRPVVGASSLLVLDGDEHLRHRRILLPAVGAQHASGVRGDGRAVHRRTRERMAPRSRDRAPARDGAHLARGDPRRRARRRAPRAPRADPRADAGDDAPLRLAVHDPAVLPASSSVGSPPTPACDGCSTSSTSSSSPRSATRRADPSTAADGADDALSAVWSPRRTEDGSELAEREIRDELLTLVMAGYETTSSALAWSFERLLRCPGQARAPARDDHRGR